MARYYDIDELAAMIRAKADTLIEGKEAFFYVAKWLDLLPAADVVPKRTLELSQHLLKDAWKNIDELGKVCGELQKAKSETISEIFEEIENIAKTVAYPEALVNGMIISHRLEGLYLDEKDFANLKNKYLEVSK